MVRALRPTSALAVVMSVCVALAWPARAQPQAESPPGKGVVAADHVVASIAGVEMLRKGGNAVDAAVAASFTLSVVRPFSCGIGGGGFMVLRVRGRDGALVETAINYREWGPGAATADMFERGDESASTIGGKAVAVPGTVAGLLTALERYGTLDRATVMRPAIVAAREGFRADAAYLKAAASTIEKFRKHPAYQKKYAFVWERLLARGAVKEGDLIQLPEQAEALELIARDGAAAFYEGPIAEAIEKAVKGDRGILNRADLKAYARQGVVESAPLVWTFAGRRVLGMPLPSSGGVAMAEAMGILERTTALDAAGQGRWAEWMQLTVESVRHAMADRSAYLWDGGTGADAAPVGRLLAGATLDALAARTGITRTNAPEACGLRAIEKAAAGGGKDDGGTSHVSVIDGAGNAAACTETINLEFGSLLAVDRYGFVLNNEMDDFTARRGQSNAFGLAQSDRNLPGPRKRPLSSMSPTVVVSAGGVVEMVAGASGGPRIITGTLQVVLNVLVRGMDVGQAVSRPRFHHQWSPNTLEIEPGMSDTWNGLGVDVWMRKLHHAVGPARSTAVVQAVTRGPDGVVRGASDPRKGGVAVGQ
ncbi:MAG: gamma-glutamyltransferase [Phycisphaerae bacterium]|nr:gamma-glutamyltransferase [Phycisphaerae bacterium]